MRAIKELVESKDPELEKKVRAMDAYLGQHTHDFHVRENCPWMDERLVIPIPLRKAVVNRIHAFHHGRSNMFDAARDVWFPYLHRSLVAAADGCKECTDADSTDPKNQKIPQPMATDWEERSDVEFDVDHMNHPRRLAQNQLVSAGDGTPMVGGKQALGGKSKQPSKRTELLFQRLKDSNKSGGGRLGFGVRADNSFKICRNPTTAPDRNVEANAPKVPKDVENIAGKANLSEGSGIPTSKGVDTEVQTMSTEQGGSAPNLKLFVGGIRPAKDTVKTRVKPLTQAQESLKDQVKAHYQLNLPHPTNERLESFCFDSQGVVFSDRFTAFNPIAKDYSNQIGPYTVCTWDVFLKEPGNKLDPLKAEYFPMYEFQNGCAILPLSSSQKPNEPKLMKYVQSGFYTPFPDPYDDQCISFLGLVEVSPGVNWNAYQIMSGLYNWCGIPWLFEASIVLSEREIKRSRVWTEYAKQLANHTHESKYGFKWLYDKYNSPQFDWFQTLIPNSSLEQGETAAFWKLCMSSEDVQATALWNLQEELDRPIKNNRYEHFKVLKYIALHIDQLLEMLPAIKTAGGVSSLQKCGDAYQIVGLFFYGLSCCPAEGEGRRFALPSVGRNVAWVNFRNEMRRIQIEKMQKAAPKR
ncbi:uncharacterized protein LOC134852033 [Symsagittifera roscoffensis]|uniref:uncharacterized protein LOC134852033 n=1 Tax=Symsagittifera roscoffensis TaxID=84072 RepID=UPI00307B804D